MLKLFYTIGQAAALSGVSVVTVRRYTESNKIHCTRTLGGHRRFEHDDLFPKENDGLTLLYARVSSRDQKEDLARQVKTLQAHCTENLDIQVAVQKMVQRHLRRIFAQKPDVAMAWLGRAALTARRRLCGS